MPVIKFQCPQCQTPLRLENRALFVGRTFDCPDCGQALQIETDGSDGVVAKPISGLSAMKLSSRTDAGFGIHLRPTASMWDQLSRRPALLGWSAAVLFAVGLFWFTRSSSKRSTSTTELSPNDSRPTAPAKLPEQIAESPNPPIAKPKPKDLAEEVVPHPLPPADAIRIADAEKQPDQKPNEPANSKPNPQPAVVVQRKLPPPPDPSDDPIPEVSGRLTAEEIATRLNQAVARFDQTKPVAFVKLLDVLEDMAGVAIVWDLDRVDDEQLQKPVSLLLEQTNVGSILDAAIKQAKLQRRFADGQIVLEPAMPD